MFPSPAVTTMVTRLVCPVTSCTVMVPLVESATPPADMSTVAECDAGRAETTIDAIAARTVTRYTMIVGENDLKSAGFGLRLSLGAWRRGCSRTKGSGD